MIYPDNIVTEGSKEALAKGIRVLQGNRFADTEEAHVDALATYMRLNGEREVADMGCGFGQVSLLLGNKLPQTRFWLVNKNLFQMTHCPVGERYTRKLEDMCATSIPGGAIDLVMFNYSLCHVNARDALAEAARIARHCSGSRVGCAGKLFVYDYQRTGGDNELTEKVLAAHFSTDAEFRAAASDAGWQDVETISPGGDDKLFREATTDQALYAAMFNHLQPVIWKAHKAADTAATTV
jgi:SAM-dependent methyltransferase